LVKIKPLKCQDLVDSTKRKAPAGAPGLSHGTRSASPPKPRNSPNCKRKSRANKKVPTIKKAPRRGCGGYPYSARLSREGGGLADLICNNAKEASEFQMIPTCMSASSDVHATKRRGSSVRPVEVRGPNHPRSATAFRKRPGHSRPRYLAGGRWAGPNHPRGYVVDGWSKNDGLIRTFQSGPALATDHRRGEEHRA
jgi:hypothetical protein